MTLTGLLIIFQMINKTHAMGIQAIQYLMDSDNVTNKNGGNSFSLVGSYLLWMLYYIFII